MSLPLAAVDQLHRKAIERTMLDECDIRTMAPGEEPAPGYPGQPVAGPVTTTRCLYPATAAQVGGGDQRFSVPIDFVLRTHAMLVPITTAVKEGDRVLVVRDRDGLSVMTTTLYVTSVQARRTHRLVLMESVS